MVQFSRKGNMELLLAWCLTMIMLSIWMISGLVKKDEKSNIQSEVEIFGKDKAAQLYQGLNDIKQIEIEISGKKDELGRVLNGLGKSLQDDEDYGNYSRLLEETKNAEKKLQKALEEAFLLYKKFQISSDKSLEEKMKTIVSNSLISSEEIKTKYKNLKEKYSVGQ